MAELKTRQTQASVNSFLKSTDNESRRDECRTLINIMQEATGSPPKMWGDAMIGFGKYHYRYASGQEGDWFITGFSPRKRELSLYIMPGFGEYDSLMSRLGKHRTGKSCLYVKRLSEVDLDVLKELVNLSVRHMKERYPKG